MNQEKIGNIIKEIRKKNNLTQQKLAEQLGVTYQAVSKWENGKNIPDIAILKEISKTYNIDINELLGDNTKKSKKKYFLILLLIIPIMFILITSQKNNFEFKTISSKCDQFKISGSIAYNQKKSSIYISDINYCGKEDTEKYKKIECHLFENDKEICSCDKEAKNKTLTEYLQEVTFNIDNLKCSKVNTLILKITATDYEDKTKTFKIPLSLNNNCKKEN